jgi:hypothetical protein
LHHAATGGVGAASMVFVDHKREKLVNAINYFVRNTKHCHTLKLFKLLNFLDFEHYRQTGFSVTGLQYKAWPQGPVPSQLWHELQNKIGDDLRRSVAVVQVKDDLTDQLVRRDLRAVAEFDPKYFSKRELKLMGLLVEFFAETPGADMSKFSHATGLPWGKVYRNGAGKWKDIPYELSRTADPVIGSIANLPDEEFRYRKEAFKELEQHV